ncbi:MAG: Signal transduction histidine kinase CheA [Schlesneria sp.]|nr:Signal transduction histidine kinase CheA [Schlesneria sp.]
MDDLEDIIKEFLVESYENLDQLDHDLLSLEDAPDDRNLLSSVFRTIHTIKGTCGFLAFPILEHVTHVGESLLVKLRDGELRLDATITTALLQMVDAVRKMLSSIANTNTEGEDHYESLVEVLEQLSLGTRMQPAAVAAFSAGRAVPAGHRLQSGSSAEDHGVEATLGDLESMVAGLANDSEAVAVRKKSKTPAAAKSRPVAKTKPAPKVRVESKPKLAQVPKAKGPRKAKVAATKTAVAQIPPAVETVEIALPTVAATAPGVRRVDADGQALPDSNEKNQIGPETTVRLDVALLDRLMNLVGELVLARNQILQYSRTTEDATLIAASQRLNLITSELQEGVMKTRMQPIQNAWAKLPRVVRDLSLQCGKKVQVKMEGAETELDKTILEAIKDPLMHIVRNSVDHGIEPPEIRQAKGKPAEGTLLLRAFHEGGQVIIEIGDDGGGINLERVRQKGLSQGLITPDQAASMSERELMNIILLPGFSTALTVTNVSGRGVGMDVVKTNVEKIGGTLDIFSVFGKGTTLRIKIPLTLAIVPALMVTAGADRYAIPQNNLVELVRLEGDRVLREIEHIHDVPVYRLRGNLLPLLYLDEQLNLRPARKGAKLSPDSVVNIVVLTAEDRRFGLVVDRIDDTQEIVVKPLGPHLKDISIYAGVTIMGDGAVALILDVVGIAKRSGVVSEARERHITPAKTNEAVTGDLKQTLLLLGLGETHQLALPLSSVSRLEEIPLSSVERADGQQVVQYGGQIMPLLHLGDVLNTGSPHLEATMLQVVVYSENGRSVGLVVDRILDIVETTLIIQQAGKRMGVLGSAVIQNRVTDLLDIHNLILSSYGDYFSPPSTTLAV